ncbi:hypothetical protein [Falsiroseomonas oryzae]|uniref:hypothetical protein n=1 Tax=Falsiroseomonas oryzae TaxID=2766473 RepID=UPI0022EB4E16|nr:hypothetical protein [Roseomonas sp. MO-31]
MPPSLARRTALALPLLFVPRARAALPHGIPPFPLWIGRTALLAGDGGAARLLLAADGTGTMTVRFFVFCRTLPVRNWQVEEDGLSLRYSRVSALDAGRMIHGEAHILREAPQLLWIEAARHTATFEGFAAADHAGRCG